MAKPRIGPVPNTANTTPVKKLVTFESTIAEIADSIMSDLRFDEQCRKNALARDRKPIKKEK